MKQENKLINAILFKVNPKLLINLLTINNLNKTPNVQPLKKKVIFTKMNLNLNPAPGRET